MIKHLEKPKFNVSFGIAIVDIQSYSTYLVNDMKSVLILALGPSPGLPPISLSITGLIVDVLTINDVPLAPILHTTWRTGGHEVITAWAGQAVAAVVCSNNNRTISTQ